MKYIFLNPFWKSWQILAILIISIALNLYIWILYIHTFKSMIDITPIAYSSGVLLINAILGYIIYPKQNLVSYILVSVGLLSQLFIIYYIKTSFIGAIQ